MWCGQGITAARRELADFSRPYAIFDESLVVRADNPSASPYELQGQRIGAIAGSTNLALAETFHRCGGGARLRGHRTSSAT